MIGGIAELIPHALAIAISPMPVLGVILMLLSSRGKGSSIGFSVGWVTGVAFITAGASALSSLVILPSLSAAESHPLLAAVPIVLGAGFVALGIVQLVRGSRVAPDAELPGWLSRVDRLSPARASLVGFAYAAFRPKNFVISVAAGLVIGQRGHDLAEVTIMVVVFSVVASLTIVAPVVIFAFGGDRVKGAVRSARGWLLRHIRTIGSVAILFVGAALIVIGLVKL
ncbi:GAP family protein [Glaciibacter superstes]|uniref:GAP family protein n=1 Tax=Glaciibacter superstes TaxID=501023 RepID=UPI0003B70E96|nr:GAP family protein [Glaciibacter superstes]